MGLPINTNLQMSMQEYLQTPALSSSALAMATLQWRSILPISRVGWSSKSKALQNWELRFMPLPIKTASRGTNSCSQAKRMEPGQRGKAFKRGESVEDDYWPRNSSNGCFGCYEAWKSSPDRLIMIARESQERSKLAGSGMKARLCARFGLTGWWRYQGATTSTLPKTWPSLFNPISNTIVVDFKLTSQSAAPRGFGYAAKNFKYLLKSAHYLAGFKANAFMFVVLETVPPFHITRYLVSQSTRNFYIRGNRSCSNNLCVVKSLVTGLDCMWVTRILLWNGYCVSSRSWKVYASRTRRWPMTRNRDTKRFKWTGWTEW